MHVKKPTLALNALQTAKEGSAVCTTGEIQHVTKQAPTEAGL